MRTLKKALVVGKFSLGALIAAMSLTASGSAHADNLFVADFPLIVVCELNGIGKVYYLSELRSDGVAVYLTQDNLAASITVTGTPKVVGGNRSGTCANKSIDQLRASGQAFDLER